jgi:hypothetical protein
MGSYMNASNNKGITLVLGPPNSGKRGLVLEWWQERLVLRPVVVMPTAPDAENMSAELAHRTRGLVGQSLAVTFAGLVKSVVGRPLRYAEEFERTVIVSRLLRSTALEALDSAAHLPGVTSALAALLLEFGESGKAPEEITALLDQWALARPDSAPLAHDIGRLLAGYTQACSSLGMLDRPSAVREAVRVAERWDRPIGLCGFTSFTRGQRALVEQLSGRVEILVTLTHERERGVGLCALEEVEWWAARASEVLEQSPRTRAYASPAIAYLERSFLHGEPPAEPPPAKSDSDGVRFLLGSGRRAEAELAAQHIAKLIREGCDPGGIAVVVRQVRPWGRLLRDVFASCGIPCQSEERSRLGETGLGHAFLQAVRGVALDDAQSLLSYLRGPYSGASVEEVCELEARYRQGVARGARVLSGVAGRGVADAMRPVWALARPVPAGERACSSSQWLDLVGTHAVGGSAGRGDRQL